MSDTPEPPEELFHLLADLVDGTLAPARAERLRALLRDDPRAQDLYCQYMDVHARLHLEAEGIGGMVPAGAGAESRRAARPRPLVSAMIGALAASVLAGGLALALWPRGTGTAPAEAGPTAARPDPIARVIRLDGVRWHPEEASPPGEWDVLPARRLRPRAGRMTLALFIGVTLTVEGPADLDLVAPDRVFCRRGKIRARVPEGAEGFVAEAPDAAVLDLGTEFGLNVEADGTSRVMVFQGEAEASVLGPGGLSQRFRAVEERESVAIDAKAGRIEPEPAVAGRFASPTTLVAPPLVLEAGYPGAVLALKPAGYWRFGAVDGGLVPNEVAGGAPLRAHGAVRLHRDGGEPADGCAVLPASDDDPYLTLEGAWAPPRESGYAIELWAMAETFRHATAVAVGVRTEEVFAHAALLELAASTGRMPRRWPGWQPATVRFLDRWPPGSSGGTNLFSRQTYAPYRWQHLVAQKHNGRMELYLDGEPVLSTLAEEDVAHPSAVLRPEEATGPFRVLIGRMTFPELNARRGIDRKDVWENRPFVGRIDELALYDRPLTPEEIRRHHRLARPPGREP